MLQGFPVGSVVMNLPANAGDAYLISGSGRSPGGGNCNLLEDSCLENLMDRGGAWSHNPWDRKRDRHDLAAKQHQQMLLLLRTGAEADLSSLCLCLQ